MAGDWAKSQGADEALILNPDRLRVGDEHRQHMLHFRQYGVFSHVGPRSARHHVGRGSAAPATLGFAIEDRRLSVEDLLASDQVLLMNSLMGAVPVLNLHDTKLGYDSALCDKINRAVFDEK